jgi:prepilin-type N-terminal cleavage/methylation domain-containing protein
MHKQKGFTLIELLLVIDIIALLMAILMPALQRVKKQAKSVICQAHLKEWSTIFALYTDDNNGFFPERRSGSMAYGRWMDSMREYYIATEDVRLCPVAKNSVLPISWYRPSIMVLLQTCLKSMAKIWVIRSSGACRNKFSTFSLFAE